MFFYIIRKGTLNFQTFFYIIKKKLLNFQKFFYIRGGQGRNFFLALPGIWGLASGGYHPWVGPQSQEEPQKSSLPFTSHLLDEKLLFFHHYVSDSFETALHICATVLTKSISTAAQYVSLDNKIKCLTLAFFFWATPPVKL